MGITKIQGATHTDERGKLVFFNDFSMKPIVRFYEINPSSTNVIRAWQGHLKETKWFYCCEGAFVFYVIAIDAEGALRPDLNVEHFILDSDDPVILQVPGGFASGFKAIKDHSKLTVYSDVSVAASIADDFRFPETAYKADWSYKA
ncbi:dTDP-4-dehydrorhamnose 3,5-epimerase family protein [Cellulophaga sp. Z1A5H]|uniref:dTDP-4-dehydrorhamnose 3,5-epimerase family protein n=1 Tax=Cellulophaga sp. Z1A5H TaxID=2687291 RepID=UPI0013FD4567|nr:dTDP-4-dehydrorhamnose 3,5-epimerase family protein [Cellulophaga sp. Z1A5H]